MTDKTFHLHIHDSIMVPEDAVENESGRGWVLPDGTLIKPYVILEKNEDEDLGHDEAMELGFCVEDDTIISTTEQ